MNDKRYYAPVELIKIATQHAYCADHLLQNNKWLEGRQRETHDSLMSVMTLMYVAFEITLKAYLLHDHRPVKQPLKLSELLDLNRDLGFSHNDLILLKKLSQQQGFRKGVDYELWDDPQQFHVFCAEILDLYERLQEMMPLELQRDYHIEN
ncbi:hypothetical protein ACFORL_12050 [Legionella dresdenensis]|uniref:DUF86 domain-containing protein n=1 Tax=Legionella dresdenensis TaxID=450200 RepID=A0ABV8CIK2_9GAMM